MTDNTPQPLDPIDVHNYYACSWIVNHHGLNQLAALADIADELGVNLRVRQMFTDQHGYLIYPFAVKVADETALRAFVAQVAAGIGMDEWYIVNAAYYEKGVPFVDNFRTVRSRMPRWIETMRQYADHNAKLHAQHSTPPDDSAPLQ